MNVDDLLRRAADYSNRARACGDSAAADPLVDDLANALRDATYAVETTLKASAHLAAQPIPMRLHCPACHALHVDEGERAKTPHRTHACQECGHLWAPAVVPTVGVKFLPGCKNGEPA